MKIHNLKVMIAFMSLMVLALACGAPGTSTEDTDATEVPATEAAPEAPPTPAIQHTTIPAELPEQQNGLAGDFDSSKVLENNSLVGGDRFTFNRFERPFNANTMDVYYPQLDIVNTEVFQDDIWIYARITLKDLSATNLLASEYAVELDTNLNGKSEWLVVADKPSSTDWSVSSVRVYQDANGDVGGTMPALTDEPAIVSDGFETLFFDQGVGDNPDTAWVRLAPSDSNIIEFALLRSALGDTSRFLINMWAGSNIDPAKADLNDAYTHEQAGAADEGLEFFYPIKAVAEIDNTCRMAVGFQPKGSEPGICPVPVKENEGTSPVPPGGSCPAGTFLFCFNGNCFCAPINILLPPAPPPVP